MTRHTHICPVCTVPWPCRRCDYRLTQPVIDQDCWERYTAWRRYLAEERWHRVWDCHECARKGARPHAALPDVTKAELAAYGVPG